VGVFGRIAVVIEVLILSFEILLQRFAEDGLSGAMADGGEPLEAFGEVGVELEVSGHCVFFSRQGFCSSYKTKAIQLKDCR
jgi:hypothetical protein